jgi:protoporphyrin/coproporphyrin ferrochelatase
MSAGKTAVVLFNLGGPDSLEAVRPFLFNLFNDRWIIRAPAPVRLALALLISFTRNKSAQANYAMMGGRSPIVPETEKQAHALQSLLTQRHGEGRTKVFIAMRYWHPLAHETAKAVRAWGADQVILLPLYPQFSTTTTASADEAWRKAYHGPTKTICCYPVGAEFIQAHAEMVIRAWEDGGKPDRPRVLFSAHGLPQRTIDAGDPYQAQVEQTVAAVRARLPAGFDSVVCYQSRVGPLKWIGPSTEDEIRRAGQDGVPVIVSPIAFVSEHIETLVELDVEYGELAHEAGVPVYMRAKALGSDARFIAALADLVDIAVARPMPVGSETGGRICPGAFGMCPMRADAQAAPAVKSEVATAA